MPTNMSETTNTTGGFYYAIEATGSADIDPNNQMALANSSDGEDQLPSNNAAASGGEVRK